MCESRVLLVGSEVDSSLRVALEERGFSVTAPVARTAALDGAVDSPAGVLVTDAYDAEFADRLRNRVGAVPVVFLAETDPAEAGIAGVRDGAVVAAAPTTPAEADALATRFERIVEFSQWMASTSKQQSLYRTVVEQSHDAIFVAQDGEFRYWNRRLEELTGLDAAELAATPFQSILHPDERPRVDDIATRRRRGEDAPTNYELRIVDADGEVHVCSANVQQITYRGSYGVLVSMRDVTERRASEARFRSLVEHARDVVTVVDGDGRIRYKSPSVRRVLGYDPGDLVGERFAGFVHPDDREAVESTFREALRDGTETVGPIRFRHRHADGTWRWLESMASNRLDDSLGGFVVTSRDVTEQRERELRLERYESIIESIHQGTYIVDTEGYLEYVNEEVADRTSVPIDEWVGSHVSVAREAGLVDDEQYEELTAALGAVFDGESSGERFELTVSTDSDRYVVEFAITPLTDRDGTVTGAVGISTNVTDRKRYEDRLNALHVSTRRLSGATSRTEVAEIVCDAAFDVLDYSVSGVLLYDEGRDALVPSAFTDEAVALFDEIPTLSRGEGLAWEVFESGEPHLYEDVRNNPRRYNPETALSEELIVPIPDHGVFLVGATDEGRLDDHRVPLAMVLASNTKAALDRVEREQLLRRRERELARQNEQLESFASAVSHDLRTPLSVASGFLDIVREQCDAPELDRVADAHDRMATIVEDVLTLARQGQTVDETSRLSLEDVARKAWDTAAADGPGASLAFDDPGVVYAHHGRLRQLLENLFSNAIRHGGGDVTVRVGRLDDAKGFYVEDDGSGVPETDRDDIFDSGFTTRDDGTGFGLSIVRTIANAHGWAVDLTESASGGARFEFVTGGGR